MRRTDGTGPAGWMRELQDLVFPPQLYCHSCGAVIDGTRTYGLCDDCITKFSWAAGSVCAKCGKRLV